VVQQLMAMPPAQAIEQLAQILEQAGAPPEILQQLEQALQLPENEQRQFLLGILEQLGGQ
tara:strand:- start:9512 stop:9691 length:180 start_codon:yes stop_codon:yes gene_type:complete